MSLLGKPLGMFSLQDSDRFVGSFITKEDVKAILSVDEVDLKDVPFMDKEGILCIDESILSKEYWTRGKISNSVPWKKGNSTISFDEYVLIAIIKNTYPEAKITSQYKWGRKFIDIYVELNDKKFFIEFHGPGHFKKMSLYQDPEDPFIRKKAIEEEFKIPCYIWPYWIQRCSRNLKILTGEKGFENYIGTGALWSTKVFFGEFFFDNSSQIIEDINKQFNAVQNDYGYYYEQWRLDDGIQKEEHPIIRSIQKGKKDRSILVPKGAGEDFEKWLPKCLC